MFAFNLNSELMDGIGDFLKNPEMTHVVDWNVDYVKLGIFLIVLFAIGVALKKI